MDSKWFILILGIIIGASIVGADTTTSKEIDYSALWEEFFVVYETLLKPLWPVFLAMSFVLFIELAKFLFRGN